ncbi:MAG: hypothetical protein LBN07_00665 [Christensenellaceae bacterium]|jgi:hypothetical protein|nr:hypothetical protein [Christensenellaceae bacterium]
MSILGYRWKDLMISFSKAKSFGKEVAEALKEKRDEKRWGYWEKRVEENSLLKDAAEEFEDNYQGDFDAMNSNDMHRILKRLDAQTSGRIGVAAICSDAVEKSKDAALRGAGYIKVQGGKLYGWLLKMINNKEEVPQMTLEENEAMIEIVDNCIDNIICGDFVKQAAQEHATPQPEPTPAEEKEFENSIEQKLNEAEQEVQTYFENFHNQDKIIEDIGKLNVEEDCAKPKQVFENIAVAENAEAETRVENISSYRYKQAFEDIKAADKIKEEISDMHQSTRSFEDIATSVKEAELVEDASSYRYKQSFEDIIEQEKPIEDSSVTELRAMKKELSSTPAWVEKDGKMVPNEGIKEIQGKIAIAERDLAGRGINFQDDGQEFHVDLPDNERSFENVAEIKKAEEYVDSEEYEEHRKAVSENIGKYDSIVMKKRYANNLEEIEQFGIEEAELEQKLTEIGFSPEDLLAMKARMHQTANQREEQFGKEAVKKYYMGPDISQQEKQSPPPQQISEDKLQEISEMPTETWVDRAKIIEEMGGGSPEDLASLKRMCEMRDQQDAAMKKPAQKPEQIMAME